MCECSIEKLIEKQIMFEKKKIDLQSAVVMRIMGTLLLYVNTANTIWAMGLKETILHQ